MSAAHDDAVHDDAHAHAFDGEPVQELAADEPRTPGWIPAVGLMLMLSVVVVTLASRDPVPGSEAGAAAPATATAAAPATPPVERPQPPARPSVAPPPSGSGPLQKLTPEQARDLQKRIEEMRKQRNPAGPGAPTPSPAPAGH